MEGNSIIGMAGGFIALSIMLGIGTLILGGSVTDCSQPRRITIHQTHLIQLAGLYNV